MTLLRQRMLEDFQIRHYSPTTIRIYLHVIAEFARHFSKPPDQLDAEHIRSYQLFLIKEKRVSQPTYIQTVCALRFFYTRRAVRHLRNYPGFSGIGTNHPYRNLQPPSCWIYNRDCTISPFWSPGDSQTITVQGMKRIENADVRRIRTQGTVGGCCCIPICIASCRAEESRPMVRAGSRAAKTPSFFPISCSASASARSSYGTCATALPQEVLMAPVQNEKRRQADAQRRKKSGKGG